MKIESQAPLRAILGVLVSTLAPIFSALPSGPAVAADAPVSIDDARFGTEVGLAPESHTPSIPTAGPPSTADFRGTSASTCASLDLNAFLHTFDPHELLNELRQSLISGAQSAVSNYLIALAYSAPTLASVLDMTDRQLGSRFGALAQTCSMQHILVSGLQEEDRRLLQASDQCFAREIARDTAPTEAYRRCTVARRFDGIELPATLSTLDFLRRHSNLQVTRRMEALLGLLPDQHIEGGHQQARPPQMSIGSLSQALRSQTLLALEDVLDGAQPSTVAECSADTIAETSGRGCLPPSASAIVRSPAFRGARLLGATARSMFVEALASQIAVVAVYSDLIDLSQQISQMGLRSDSQASAQDVFSRKRTMLQAVAGLLGQADLQVKLEESRLRLARTQLLALERAEVDLDTRGAALQAEQQLPALSGRGLLRLFEDRN
jgi:hypothetical protein